MEGLGRCSTLQKHYPSLSPTRCVSLPDHFQRQDHEYEDYQWYLHEAGLSREEVRQVARSLVEAFLEHRCSDELVTAWKEKRSGDRSNHPEHIQEVLEVFIEKAFGLPPAGEEPSDHVQGVVAEHLWYYLKAHSDAEYAHLEPPDLDITSGGGDSISVQRPEEDLEFRLWEIKKCTGDSLRSTITNAYRQVEDNGPRYLAQMTTIKQEDDHNQELANFFSRLPELWCSNSPRSSVGISVAIPNSLTPDDCFDDFPDRFPNRSLPEGVVKVVGDYEDFVQTVQKEAWKGL